MGSVYKSHFLPHTGGVADAVSRYLRTELRYLDAVHDKRLSV